MWFNQDGAIFSLDSKSLKLVDLFIYLCSNVSSIENDVDISKAMIIIHWLITIWKSDLYDKIKLEFFQASAMSVLLYDCITRTLTKYLRGKS